MNKNYSYLMPLATSCTLQSMQREGFKNYAVQTAFGLTSPRFLYVAIENQAGTSSLTFQFCCRAQCIVIW